VVGGQKLAVKVEAIDAFNTGFTCGASTQISKGTLLKLTDSRTASKADAATAAAGTGVPGAGIAALEKKASDNSTEITVWKQGIFDLVSSGAAIVGDPAVFVADGYVARAQKGQEASVGIVGRYLETAADGETVEVQIDL